LVHSIGLIKFLMTYWNKAEAMFQDQFYEALFNLDFCWTLFD
jgi:hypothetical protein